MAWRAPFPRARATWTTSILLGLSMPAAATALRWAIASVVGWAAVAVFVPLLVGRFEENGFRAPMISGGIRVVADIIEAAPRNDWPVRLEAAQRALNVPLAIVPRAALAPATT